MSNFSLKILQSLNIISEMFAYRGHTTEHLEKISINEVNILLDVAHQNSLNLFEIKINDNTKVIYVYNKYTQKMIKNFLINNFCKNIIIVLSDNISSDKSIKKDLLLHNTDAEDDDSKVNYQIFKLNELQYNISKYNMASKHILIDDPVDIAKIIKKYNIENKSKMPRILVDDKMAKFINAKSGNIVKITHRNDANDYTSYRYCV